MVSAPVARYRSRRKIVAPRPSMTTPQEGERQPALQVHARVEPARDPDPSHRSSSRWKTSTDASGISPSRRASSSARAIERWYPPVQPERHPQLLSSLGSVGRRGQLEELDDEVEEPVRRRLAHDEVADLVLESRERLELRIPERVRQEAHVEDEVGLERDPVLEAEGDDVDAQPVAGVVPRQDREQPILRAARWRARSCRST